MNNDFLGDLLEDLKREDKEIVELIVKAAVLNKAVKFESATEIFLKKEIRGLNNYSIKRVAGNANKIAKVLNDNRDEKYVAKYEDVVVFAVKECIKEYKKRVQDKTI